MSADKVDKHWQRDGLAGYSTPAIVGTLAHYGVPLDEAQVGALAAKHYPLALASQWHESWTGTGQFARFPLAAADELWRRSCPDKLSPDALAQALADLVNELGEVLARGKSAGMEKAFTDAEALQAKLPQKDGAPEEAFLDDVFGRMDEGLIRAFDEVAERLGQAGQHAPAERFAALEETLIPQRKGITRALLQNARGDKEGAVKALEALAADPARQGAAQLLPVDALIHLGEHEKALAHAKRLLDAAEAAKEYHLALELCGRTAHVLEQLHRSEEMEALEERMEKIAAEHDAAHPHHTHHGHEG